MLVDTHAHLQWKSFDKDLDMVINRARKADVKCIVNVGFDVDGNRKAIELADKHKDLFAAVGIHPHNASEFNEKVMHEIKRLSKNQKVVAIGEIGLDYYRNLSPRETQKEAFETQLALAKELALPVIIHDREAHIDILQILSKFKGKIHGIMHCFSGDRRMAQQCIELDFYISFAGSVTFPSSHQLHEVVKWANLSDILLETDSPWLAPQGFRGRRNEPAFLPFTAKKIAELKDLSIAEVVEATTENAKKIFRL